MYIKLFKALFVSADNDAGRCRLMTNWRNNVCCDVMLFFLNTPEVNIDRLADCQHYRQHKSMRTVPVGFVCQLHEMAAVWKTPDMAKASGDGRQKGQRKTTASAVTLPACLIWSQRGGVNYATCISRGIESLGGRHCSERRRTMKPD